MDSNGNNGDDNIYNIALNGLTRTIPSLIRSYKVIPGRIIVAITAISIMPNLILFILSPILKAYVDLSAFIRLLFAVIVLIFLLIRVIIIRGYFIRVLRYSRNKNHEFPHFTNFRLLIVEGIESTAIFFTYSPLLIIAGILGGIPVSAIYTGFLGLFDERFIQYLIGENLLPSITIVSKLVKQLCTHQKIDGITTTLYFVKNSMIGIIVTTATSYFYFGAVSHYAVSHDLKSAFKYEKLKKTWLDNSYASGWFTALVPLTLVGFLRSFTSLISILLSCINLYNMVNRFLPFQNVEYDVLIVNSITSVYWLIVI
jgi:hypothetical protein